MAEKLPVIQYTDDSLLSSKERVACQAVVAKQSGLASQRAAVLLALAEGTTQIKAAELSGLTIGQIRYLLTIFRRKGMDIFPVVEIDTSSSLVAGQPEVKKSVEPSIEEETVQPAKKEKKHVTAKNKKKKKKSAEKKEKDKTKGAGKDQGKKIKKKTKKKKKNKTKKTK